MINTCKLQAAACGIVGCASNCAAGHKWYTWQCHKKHLCTNRKLNILLQNIYIYNIVYLRLICNYLIRCTCACWCVLCKFAPLFAVDHSTTTQTTKV